MNKKLLLIVSMTISSLSFARGARPICEPDSSYVQEFDSAAVAALARRTLPVVRRATFMAETYRSGPTADNSRYYAIDSLTKIQRQVPWIFLKIEEHPEQARCKSQLSADRIRLELVWLKNTYRGAIFHPNVNRAIEDSIELLDEILKSYEMIPAEEISRLSITDS